METKHGWDGPAPAGRIAYVNGRYLRHGEAAIHIEDRGLQFADAIYEVWGVTGGLLLDTAPHLDRLERSLKELGMAMPMGRAALQVVLREVARRNRVSDGLIYLQVTRGTTRRDHPIPDDAARPTIIVTARNMDARALVKRRREGVSVITMADERWARCDIKSTALLPNILAKTAARRAGAYEAWLVDADGFVTEGSSTTAWMVDAEGQIVTRDLSNAVLPGVTRRVIFQAAAEAQIPIIERRFTPAEAKAGSGAFLTAATAGVIPITAIDGKSIGGGHIPPIVTRIQELYALSSRKAAAQAG